MKRHVPEKKAQTNNARYNHRAVEITWQRAWEKQKLDVVPIGTAKKPFYNLMMFPYPSAEGLHVGNMYAFTGADIYGRYKRMQGFDVFEPIGLDGFGIHSENYALKVGMHPREQAAISEKKYYEQLQTIGAMFDWSRTLETYDPEYYRWTQWVFVQMFKHGCAYRGKSDVNWCPSCKTVLADEQVTNGVCERCGNIVEKRLLEQWFFSITAYAEKLLRNLNELDWSNKVKIAQELWIGKKVGVEIVYPIIDSKGSEIAEVACFTTRPDTNFGATFVVLAPDHPLINQLLQVIDQQIARKIDAYRKRAIGMSKEKRIAQRRDKTGFFTGLYCVNRANGYRMMLFVSDFVLKDVGSGAVVGVPGHDKRDFEFAETFRLPVIRVVVGSDRTGEGVVTNSGFLNGLGTREARERMTEFLEQKMWGNRKVTFHLRDWLISRQRYWGAPIPMIYCEKCAGEGKSWFTTSEAISAATRQPSIGNPVHDMRGWYPVPEHELPVLLPRIEDYQPRGDGKSPLARHEEFYRVTCPGCGSSARRETDVSDTFLDSSWYFLRYPSVYVKNSKSEARSTKQASGDLPWDPKITKKWLPVDMYTGGAEHSVLHLMYSRFITMALHDWGYLDFEEPFLRFYAHGLVVKDGAKMSKSKGNVVNPDEYIAAYGADSLRLYLMFMGPFDHGGDFRDEAMEGMYRWVNRVWRLGISNKQGETSRETQRTLHRLVKKVTEDIEKRRYNTAIASMMEFTNTVTDSNATLHPDSLKTFTILLAPFAPYLAEELWQQIHGRTDKEFRSPDSVHRAVWPTYTLEALREKYAQIVIQVNGKTRDVISVEEKTASDAGSVETLVRKSERVKKYLAESRVQRVVFVSGKLINFVTSRE